MQYSAVPALSLVLTATFVLSVLLLLLDGVFWLRCLEEQRGEAVGSWLCLELWLLIASDELKASILQEHQVGCHREHKLLATRAESI